MDDRIEKKLQKTHNLVHFDPISDPLGGQLGFPCASQIVRSSRPIVQHKFPSNTGNTELTLASRIEKNLQKT